MGFQFLSILAAEGNRSVLVENHFDSENLALPLEWTAAAQKSPWVQAMPQAVYNTLTHENSTANLHHDGVTPGTFFTNPLLPEFFEVVSTNHDRKGQEFLSTIEGKRYPIRGVQWHPERNAFEWKEELNINHGAHAVAANNWMADFFTQEARRNTPASRNMDLIARFTTYSMKRQLVGSVLNGYEYLHFQGFSTGASVV